MSDLFFVIVFEFILFFLTYLEGYKNLYSSLSSFVLIYTTTHLGCLCICVSEKITEK